MPREVDGDMQFEVHGNEWMVVHWSEEVRVAVVLVLLLIVLFNVIVPLGELRGDYKAKPN